MSRLTAGFVWYIGYRLLLVDISRVKGSANPNIEQINLVAGNGYFIFSTVRIMVRRLWMEARR